MNRNGIKGLQISFSAVGLLPVLLSLGACGPAAGTGPHEMSASQHQQATQAEMAEDTSHGEQYDPKAQHKRLSCAPGTVKSGICWRDVVNPTKEHEELAEKHRKLAAQHRAASDALVAAEKQACAGLDDEDRDESPFAHKDDIKSVSRLRGEVQTAGGLTPGGWEGATILFRAVPGLTAPFFQRIIDCHLARNSAVGHDAASQEMEYCPLTLKGAQATVREEGSGFAVDIRSKEPGMADEIWRVAQRRAPSRG
jgi:hypothetical protein